MRYAAGTLTTAVLLLAMPSGAKEQFVNVKNGEARFYWTSCSSNPKSVMGQIPEGTRIEVVDQVPCSQLVSGRGHTAKLGYELVYYQVIWDGGRVWIPSTATNVPIVRTKADAEREAATAEQTAREMKLRYLRERGLLP